jgi:hypothetical protein
MISAMNDELVKNSKVLPTYCNILMHHLLGKQVGNFC